MSSISSLLIRSSVKTTRRGGARPGAIHNAFGGPFAAFARDAEENKALFAKVGKLRLPVLAIGGDHSFGASMKSELEFVANDVQGAVITDSGHWIISNIVASPSSVVKRRLRNVAFACWTPPSNARSALR